MKKKELKYLVQTLRVHVQKLDIKVRRLEGFIYDNNMPALDSLKKQCPDCKGTGTQHHPDGVGQWPCPTCNATGIRKLKKKSKTKGQDEEL